MRTFRVTIEIGTPQGTGFEPVAMLVDTGAAYSWVPGDVLRRLGVRAVRKMTFVMADGRRADHEMGETRVRIHGEELTTLVVFGGTESALLGAFTLEAFALAADSLNHQLIPVPELPMA